MAEIEGMDGFVLAFSRTCRGEDIGDALFVDKEPFGRGRRGDLDAEAFADVAVSVADSRDKQYQHAGAGHAPEGGREDFPDI